MPNTAVSLQMRKVITVDFERMSYFPPIFFNDFWLLKDYMIPMNSTVKEVPLHFTVSGLSGFKYMMYNQAEQSFNMQVSPTFPSFPARGASQLPTAFSFWSLHPAKPLSSWRLSKLPSADLHHQPLTILSRNPQ